MKITKQYLKQVILEEIQLTFLEGKVQDLKKKYPSLSPVIDDLSSKDPSKTNKYLDWSLKHYKEAPLQDLTNVIDNFHKNSQRLQKKDINQYKDFEELKNTVSALGASSKQKEKEAKENAIKLYDENNIVLLKPLSLEASCYYGKGTKWCISAEESNNYFRVFTSKGERLYFIINKALDIKNKNYKTAYRIGKGIDVWDSTNKEINRDEVAKIIGKDLEKRLYSLMLQDAKSAKTKSGSDINFSVSDKEVQILMNLVKRILKAEKEDNYGSTRELEIILQDNLLDIEQTDPEKYIMLKNMLKPYVSKSETINSVFTYGIN